MICAKTVMDTTDSNIVFDGNGISDYYWNFKNNIEPTWNTDEEGMKQLQIVADKIRYEGANQDFDCILGVSGGLDSSYTAYVLKEILNLRPLLFHVDAGCNTKQAVSNIEKLVDGLNVDLFTEVIDWEEMKVFHRAFLKSQIADQDIPQDTVFFSSLYRFAHKHKIKYVVTGSNISTECIREPEEWGAYPGIDRRLIEDILAKFGEKKLSNLPIVDILKYKIYYQQILGMKLVKPLDYFPYIKKDAEKLLSEKFGWEAFQHKHHESRFTRFFEDFWLPRKFGFDKRKAHFSSLILTNQMTREEALQRLKSPEMSEEFLQREFDFVASKLDFTRLELQSIFEGHNKSYKDYRSKKTLVDIGKSALIFTKKERRLMR